MDQADCLVELPGVLGFPICKFSLLLCLIIVVVPYNDQELPLESLLKVTNARLITVSPWALGSSVYYLVLEREAVYFYFWISSG